MTTSKENAGNDKKDLGYPTDKIVFPPLTLAGIFDTDGKYSIEIKNRASGVMTPARMNYTVQLKCVQQTPNRDVVDSLKHTFGYGHIGNTSASGNRQAKVTFSLNFWEFDQQPEGSPTHFIPLMAGKRRDYLIAQKIANHQDNSYLYFDELSKNPEGQKEFQALSEKEKRKAGTIACLYLRYNTAPKIRVSLKKQEENLKELENEISSLEPEDSSYSIGMRLGKYFLQNVDQQVEKLNNQLRDPNYKLPDDYVVGLFIGDGSLETHLNFAGLRVKTGFNFTVTLGADGRTTLEALKNKFGGAGSILRTSREETAYRYNLRDAKDLRTYLFPLLNNAKLTYSKKMEWEIFKETKDLAENQAYHTKDGAYKMIELWNEISLYHKTPRKTPKEVMYQQADEYLAHRHRQEMT